MNTNAMQRADFAAIANWIKPGARVLDLGCGDGSLLRFLAEQRDSIGYGVEIDDAGVLACVNNGVNVVQGDMERGLSGFADELPFEDGEFDAAVASLVLCSVPDQARALSELRRVLRANGELRFYEHVIARRQPKRALFALADRSGAWPALAAGCHLARDTGAAITAAGFVVESCERIEFRSAALEPRLSYILGSARRP